MGVTTILIIGLAANLCVFLLQIPVFSLGSTDTEHASELSTETPATPIESSVDKNVGDAHQPPDNLPPVRTPTLQSSSHFPAKSSTGPKPSRDSDSLQALGEQFQAVWFTYDYVNVGPQRSVEECTEVLRVGVVCAVFSPDVVHRLELFLGAFKKSLTVTPSFSTGKMSLLSWS